MSICSIFWREGLFYSSFPVDDHAESFSNARASANLGKRCPNMNRRVHRYTSGVKSQWRRRCLLLSLLAVAVFAAGRLAGWIFLRQSTVTKQRDIQALVDELGGHFYFDYQLVDGNDERLADDDGRECRPSFLGRIAGRDWWHDVFYVSFAQYRISNRDGAVTIRREQIGDRQIEQLVQLKGLKWLALSGTALTDAGVEQLALLPELERLWLSQTAVTDRGMLFLAACPTLTHLALEGTPMSDRGLATVAKLPRLKFLSLGSPYLTSEGLSALAESQALEDLQLDQLPVNARVMHSIGTLKNLRRLSLRATPVTDEGFSELGRLSRLTRLHLDGTSISDNALSSASSWPELVELSIAHTAVSDQGLAHLKDCVKLESLTLSGTNCTLNGILDLFTRKQKRTISEAFHCVFESRRDRENLISLDLSGTRVTDTDIRHFAPFSKLEWLIMPHNELTDVGAQAIAALNMPHLSLLNINGAKITDRGLAALTRLPALRNLHVVGTGVSSETVATMQRTFPSLRVYNQEIRQSHP